MRSEAEKFSLGPIGCDGDILDLLVGDTIVDVGEPGT